MKKLANYEKKIRDSMLNDISAIQNLTTSIFLSILEKIKIRLCTCTYKKFHDDSGWMTNLQKLMTFS